LFEGDRRTRWEENVGDKDTSVETSVAASSTNQALRLPTKSVVRRTTFAKSCKKATVLRKITLFGST